MPNAWGDTKAAVRKYWDRLSNPRRVAVVVLPIIVLIGVSAPALVGHRDDYSYRKGQEYSSAALSWYGQGGARDHRDACRQQLKMYNRFGAIGTGRDDPPAVDGDDFMQGCLDAVGAN